MSRQGGRHAVDELGAGQVPHADVHRDPQVQACPSPFGRLRHGPVQHVSGQLLDQPAALGQRHELLRGDQTACRVPPADQRLDTRDPARRQLRLRLVVHLEVAVGQRTAELTEDDQPRGAVAVAGSLVVLDAGAVLLREIHRDVGVLE